LRAIIAQCERVNPKVNAFTYTFFDRALEQAKAAEARYAKGDGVRPLEGIPQPLPSSGLAPGGSIGRRELMKT
jgi:Asp-tRNA(Asn)/Glu-tRNA(Gln) amidotransferase A subunit family amidase